MRLIHALCVVLLCVCSSAAQSAPLHLYAFVTPLPLPVFVPNTIQSEEIVINQTAFILTHYRSNGSAMTYRIAIGRDGFRWRGIGYIDNKVEWPSWRPPSEMRKRQPNLPRHMAGGPNNPLGARALYIAGTLYRIHGTNSPSSIGQAVSSGCFRMRNEDVVDLYNHVAIGTKVIVQ